MYHDGMFRQLIERSDDIVLVVDQGHMIVYASPSAVAIFRIPAEKIIGKSIFRFFDREKIEAWNTGLRDAPHSNIREVIWPSDQTSAFDVEVTSLDRDFQGMILRLHDVTDQKSREKELIRANNQLDQVMYKTTHDLKAPLMSALGLIGLTEKATGEEQKHYLTLMKSSLLRLNGYIEDMNNFFRNEKLAVQCERISMATLIKEELEDLQSLHEQSGMRIEIELKGQCEFYSDSLRVRTIVGNLLSNAIKYRDPAKPEPFINIYVSISGEFCDLRVADNGIGIAQEYHQRIFDLFFRATDHSKGTGLGLFIVRDTLEKLKGKIEVHSILGQGSTFTIQLPNRIGQPVVVE